MQKSLLRILLGTLVCSIVIASWVRAETGSPAAELHRAILDAIDGIAADVPDMKESAEAAAKMFVEQDLPIAAAGDVPFVTEALGRSGGLMKLVRLPMDDPAWKGVVLYALDARRFDADLPRIAQLKTAGAYVVAFARPDEAQEATARGAVLDAVIDNHASKDLVVPSDGIADIAAMWTWTGEFVAACTRLGKMPTMYLGYVNPGGREREKKLAGAKFHAETPQPVPAGELGAQFLARLKENMTALGQELPKIRQAAEEANKSRQAGGKLYLVTIGHAMGPMLDAEPQPGFFENFPTSKDSTVQPQAGDFILFDGYSFIPDDADWSHLLDVLTHTPATVVWSMAGYQPAEVAKIPKDDLYIEQHWNAPDADVVVPGYDIKVIPTSGAIGEAVYWMIVADMAGE